LVINAAEREGLKEYLENDILGTMSRPDFVIDLGLDDVVNSAVATIIMDSMAINPNGPLSRVFNTLLNPAAANGVVQPQPRNEPNNEGNDGAAANAVGQVNVLAAQNPLQNMDIPAANRMINLPLFKNEVVRLAKQKNAKALLLMVQNVDAQILAEITRLNNAHQIYKKLKGKYGDENDDTEFWLRKLRSLNAKEDNQVMKVLDSVMDIYQEMDIRRITLGPREKLKYMYSLIPRNFRENLNITLQTTHEQLYEMAKNRINAKSYLEGWEEDNNHIDDPMDIDFLSRNNESKRKRSHNRGKKRSPYCNKCNKYGHTNEDCKQNNHNESNNRNKNKNQRNKYYGRQSQKKSKQNQKELNLVEAYSDNENLDLNVDFEDIRPLTINLVEEIQIPTEEIKETTKVIHYVDKNNVYDEWIYDTGAPEHIVNDKNILDNFVEKEITLRCANGFPCTFNGIGTYTFKLNGREFKLKRVLFFKGN